MYRSIGENNGKRTDLFRAPYGEYNAETVKTAKTRVLYNTMGCGFS